MPMNVARAGDVAADTPSDFILLYGFIATDGHVSHLRQPFTTTGYQVTGGKTLYMCRAKVTGTGASGWWKFGYADNDVGLDTATARTNGVMGLGLDDTGLNGVLLLESNLATVTNPAPQDNLFWKIAIGSKYPFLRRVGATPNQSIMIWAFEL